MSWRTTFFSSAFAAALTLTMGVGVGGTAHAQSAPTALIIGNSNYDNYADLRSSAADAEAIASRLTASGYAVALVTDASAEAMRSAISAFAASGGDSDHRLFFYAGHSVNVDGAEYLVPVDASVTTGLDLDFNFISMRAVNAQLERDRTPDLVIMDTGYRHFADNELASVLPGAEVSDTPGVPADSADILTLTAVEPGTNNISQANRRNVFADLLATRLSRQDQEAQAFFASLAQRVAAQSLNRQRPYLSDGFLGDVILNETAPIPVPEPAGPTAREERLWNLIVGSTDPQDYQDYLAFFPEGYYADEARAAIAALTETDTPDEPSAPVYDISPINEPYYIVRLANVRSGPSTDFARLATLPENTIVNNLGRVAGTRWFQIVMPDNSVGYIFDTLIVPWNGSELQAWALAESQGTIPAYQDYLNAYPQGPNAETARRNMLILKEQAYQEALAAYAIRPVDEVVVVLRRANVRLLPSTRSDIVATLEAGTRLRATGDVRAESWTRLDLNGKPVFIYDTLFVPYAGSVYEAWDQALEADTVLGYIRFRNNFPNSAFEDEAIANIRALQAAQDARFIPIGEQYVITRISSLFSEPSRQSDIITEVNPGETFPALRQTEDGRWIELRLGRGQVGYVRAGRAEPYLDSVFEGWALAQAEGTLVSYRAFRDAFPGSRFDEQAVAAIEDLIANQNAMQDISETLYVPVRAFVFTQPDVNAPRLGVLAANSLVPGTGKGGDPVFYRIETSSGVGYLRQEAAEPYAGSEREAWDNARRANTVEAVNAYLAAYPNGRWLQDAIELRQRLAPQAQGYQFNLGGLNIRLVPHSGN